MRLYLFIMSAYSLPLKITFIIITACVIPAQAQDQDSNQDQDAVTAELRPWCKITSEEIHSRTQGTWVRTKISYQWEGLIATMTGDKIGVVQYNRWGEVVRATWRYASEPESSIRVEENQWDCSLGWCRPADFQWDGLSWNRDNHEESLTYNTLGYITSRIVRNSPEFLLNHTWMYECGDRFCKPLRERRGQSCTQCGGSSRKKITTYAWSGTTAKVSVEYERTYGSKVGRKYQGRGTVMLSATGQVMRRDISYTHGDFVSERFTYRCER